MLSFYFITAISAEVQLLRPTETAAERCNALKF